LIAVEWKACRHLAPSLRAFPQLERPIVLDAKQTRSLATEKDLEHPVEAVWRAMTDSEWLAV
jgi:hypothetical protein